MLHRKDKTFHTGQMNDFNTVLKALSTAIAEFETQHKRRKEMIKTFEEYGMKKWKE